MTASIIFLCIFFAVAVFWLGYTVGWSSNDNSFNKQMRRRRQIDIQNTIESFGRTTRK